MQVESINQALVNVQNTILSSNLMQTTLQQQVAQANASAKKLLANKTIQNLYLFGNTRVQYTTQEVMALLGTINPNGVTFDLLKSYPSSQLSAKQNAIRAYIIANPVFFNKVANLAKPQGVLNASDIAVYAQAIAKTEVGAKTVTASQTRQAPPVENTTTRRPTQVGNEVVNERLTYAELSQQARPYYQVPQSTNLVQGNAQQLPISSKIDPSKSELVRALASAYVPQAQKSKEIIEAEKEEYRVQAISEGEPSKGIEAYIKPFLVYHHNVELNANDILKAFRAVAGEKHEVTLEQLRDFETQDQELSKILGVLRQMHVFEQLAEFDHDAHSLSKRDILLATAGHDFVLEDEHLTLVIKPIKRTK